MNPEDFLLTASTLRDSIREPDLRSCVSRAYYAVYHILRVALLQSFPLILLQNSGLGSKNHISHDKLPMALKSSTDPVLVTIGRQLWLLKSQRTKADYDLDARQTPLIAVEYHKIALALRDDIKSYGVNNLVAKLRSDLEHIHGPVS